MFLKNKVLLICLLFFMGIINIYAKSNLLTDEDKLWIKNNFEKKNMPYGLEMPPYVYGDENGKRKGIIKDYFFLLEKKLGYKFNRIKVHNWPDAVRKFRLGDIHIIFIQKTAEREKYFEFIKTGLNFPFVIISTKDSKPLQVNDLNGKKIVLEEGFSVTKEYIKKNYPKIEIIEAKDSTEALYKVSFKEVDAMIINIAVASYIIEENKILNLKVAGKVEKNEELFIAIPKTEMKLAKIIEKGVQEVEKNEINKIKRKWISLSKEPFYKNKKTIRIILTIALVSFLIVLFFIIYNFSLKGKIKRKTRDLIDKNAILFAQLESSQEAILVVNNNREIIDYNNKFLDIWNLENEDLKKSEEFILDKLLDLVLNETEFMEKIKEIYEKNENELKELIILKDNRVLERYTSLIETKDKKIIGRIWYYKDISDLVKKEKELSLFKTKSEELEEAKNKFLENISSEIITPINGIIGMSELLGMTDLNEEQIDYVNSIGYATHDLLFFIEGIISMSNINQKMLQINRSIINLKIMVNEILNRFLNLSQEKEIKFNYNISSDFISNIIGDYNKLKEILISIIGILLKFMDKGEILIQIKKIDETDKSIRLKFNIKEVGLEMNKESILEIFEPFYSNYSDLKKLNSSGVGLMVAKNYLDLLGGRLEIDTSYSNLSSFSFVLEFEKND